MQVHVVMGNDFPEAVFTDAAQAEAFCQSKRVLEATADTKARSQRRERQVRIHWRVYNFELDREIT